MSDTKQSEITHEEIDRALANSTPNRSDEEIKAERLAAISRFNELESGFTVGANVQPKNFAELFYLAKVVAKSGLVGDRFQSPNDVLVAMMYGMDLGMSPSRSLHSVAVVHGKAALYGDDPLAMCWASGLMTRYEETVNISEPSTAPKDWPDEWGVTATATREGQEPMSKTFTVAHAKRAGLWGKGNYNSWPERMLTYRARGPLLRTLFADVLGGFHTFEELEDAGMPFNPDRMRSGPAKRNEQLEQAVLDLPED